MSEFNPSQTQMDVKTELGVKILRITQDVTYYGHFVALRGNLK